MARAYPSSGQQRNARLVLLVTLIIVALSGTPILACYSTNSAENRAKNLIVFVVDGFGYGAQSLARLALSTPENPLRLESLPYVGVLNVFGRTTLRNDERSALWGLIYGLGADPGEVPPQASEKASWFTVAKEVGLRSTGIISDGSLAEGPWPLGAVVQPDANGIVPPARIPAQSAPDFLFGWAPQGSDWSSAPSGAKVSVANKWGDGQAAKDGLWYLLPGAPADPLSGEASPNPAQVVDLALKRLSANPEGFVLLVHAGGLGKALKARDLGLATAQLALLDEAVAKVLAFSEQTESTAVLVFSTGDPTGLTLLDTFNPRALDGLQKPVATVAAQVAADQTIAGAQSAVKSGLGLEISAEDAKTLRSLSGGQLERALADRVAEKVGVRFGTAGPVINPAPIMGYGPGAWVYGRLAKAPEIPALVAGQLWLDPTSLSREVAVK